MRVWRRGLLLGVLVALLVGMRAASAQGEGVALVLRLKGPLTPVMVQYLERGLTTARRQHDALVVLELDTPGGSITLMEQMVQDIRNSPVPVVVYVMPRGAMAGSAGALVTLAGHWAAMAPETAIGAASPVGPQGGDLGKTMEAKVKAILEALARSLAARRGPKAVQAAEKMVGEAQALSAEEAHRVGLVDFLAPSLDDLLHQMAGQSTTTVAGEVTLPPSLEAVPLPPTIGESFFHTLTDPNIVFILLGLGVQALLIALWHPANWPAWFVGVASLLLAAYGLSLLPVNWVGLAFLLLSFAMFALDVKAHTHGALTAAGLAAFIFGALTLFNTPAALPGQRVSVPLVVGSGLAVAVVSMGVVALALRAQQRPVQTGEARVRTLVGKIGEARTAITPRQSGTVQVGGELWTAVLASGDTAVASGDLVEVMEVRGVHLVVRPVSGDATPVVE